MRYQIRRVSIHQTAKIAAILYALMGLLFLPLFWFAIRFSPSAQVPARGMGLLALLPVLYGVLGYIFSAIMLAIYNAVAGMAGGVEMELEGVGEPSA